MVVILLLNRQIKQPDLLLCLTDDINVETLETTNFGYGHSLF
jgi:hypothetical protein